MSTILHARSAYNRDAILAATPAQIVVMLYDRLALDLARAEAAQAEQRWLEASPQLLHAQDIITELQASLRLDVWDGASGLFAVYTYLRNALVAANVSRSIERTREAQRLVEPLRLAWHQAAAEIGATATEHGVGDLGVA